MQAHPARGVIRHEERAKQLNNFEGLRFGNITPTDLDGYIEYKNRLWVVMEFKFEDAVMPFGQKLAIERLCHDLSQIKPTLGILASHSHPPHEQVDCANAQVIELWRNGWQPQVTPLIVKDAVERFLTASGLNITTAPEIDWQLGVMCGILRRPCRLCRGVPCEGSVPITP